jgi:hypothetical protein
MAEDTNSLDKRTAEYHKAMADLRHARENLYRAIRRETAKGITTRTVAQQTGLTFSRIAQIVREGKEDAS